MSFKYFNVSITFLVKSREFVDIYNSVALTKLHLYFRSITADESYIMTYNSTNLLLLIMDKTCPTRGNIFNNSYGNEEQFTGIKTVQVPCQGNKTNCELKLKYPSWKKDTTIDSRICRAFNVDKRAQGYDCQIRLVSFVF